MHLLMLHPLQSIYLTDPYPYSIQAQARQGQKARTRPGDGGGKGRAGTKPNANPGKHTAPSTQAAQAGP